MHRGKGLATFRPVELVGVSEIADRLGVSRARVHQLAKRADWPEPVARLSAGTIWLRADVERWIAEHPVRPPGRPSEPWPDEL